MEDDDAEGPHHPDGYVSISRQRLARVASACNSTIMKLTSIAEEKEMDHLGDDDDSNFQVISIFFTHLYIPFLTYYII